MVKHAVILRGYGAAANDYSAAPVVVKRTDQEFVPGLLDGLRQNLSAADLGQPGSADYRDGCLRLFQPVHRTFNLAVLEAVCPRPGSPRLDPRSLVSGGFVVRRVTNSARPEQDEGWLMRADHVVGWGVPSDPTLDPDPAQRRPRLNAGNPHVNGRLSRLYATLEPAAERVSPLFVAPPDICADAGRTLLYGVIPVTSSERSEQAQTVEIDAGIVTASLPKFLRTPSQNDPWPDLSGPLTFDDVNGAVNAATDENAALGRFIQELRLIQFGWRLFDTPEGAVILPLLNQVTLTFGDGGTQRLGDYVSELIHRFILRDDGSTANVAFPVGWPQPDAPLVAQICTAVGQALAANLRANVPNQPRFDEPKALYRLHAFIRARGDHANCPPELHWSAPSAPFAIVPWWESGGGPLHTISLPNLTLDSIRKLKPNVAFKVPPQIAALLNQSPDDFLKGKAKAPVAGLSLGWICSFSLPAITICAFIVLSIFLALLNIVFWWMFFIKICLPFPKPAAASEP